MKKILVCIIGVALLLSMSWAVSAGSIGNPYDIEPSGDNDYIQANHTGTVTVKYSVTQEEYVVVIPGTVSFTTDDETLTSEVNITSLTLSALRTMEVKVNSTHGFKLVEHTGGQANMNRFINYSMTYKDDSGNDRTANSETPGTDEFVILSTVAGVKKSTPVTFKMTDAAPGTGHFRDTLTFTVVVSGQYNDVGDDPDQSDTQE